ncbi:MAG: CRISPR-associated endonuclease Cas1 [Actinomycetota bacterium]
MRLLSTLYVTDHRARVGVRKKSLIVTGSDGWERVPMKELDGVVLLGAGQISSQALSGCVEQGIRVVSLNRGGKVRFVVGGATKGNVYLRIAQYRAAEDAGRTCEISRSVVAGKLQNCRGLLTRWAWDAEGTDRKALEQDKSAVQRGIEALGSARDGDHIRGIEGDSTRRYFKGIRTHLSAVGSPFDFSTRSRRPPRDPVNAMLSFMYALVLTEVTGALETLGLDPQVGYLHGVRPGRPSLALDIVEELRPAIADRFVVRLIALGQSKPQHFVYTHGGGCYLNEEGRRVLLSSYEEFKGEEVHHSLLSRSVPRWALPTIQATLMARHLRGDVPSYAPYVSEI